MAEPVRAVLDTNILVGALLRGSGIARKVLKAAIDGRYRLVSSRAILDEMIDVLMRPVLQRHHGLPENDIARYRVFIGGNADVTKGDYRELDIVPTDVKDNPVAATALEGDARYLVTFDASDLLPLKVLLRSGHRPVQIVDPAAFLRILPMARSA